MKHLNHKPLGLALLAALILGISPFPVLADFYSNLGKTRVNGRSYDRLAAQWYEHYISIPDPAHPGLAVGEVDCAPDQTGMIWFLVNPVPQFGGWNPVELECTVPRRILFFPVLTVFYANYPEDDPPADEAFKRFANEFVVESACELQVTLDDVPLEYSAPIVRSQTRAFPFSAEEGRNIFQVPAGTDDPETYADGQWVALPPLPAGEHVLHYRSGVLCDDDGVPLLSHDVTYHLTVVGGP